MTEVGAGHPSARSPRQGWRHAGSTGVARRRLVPLVGPTVVLLVLGGLWLGYRGLTVLRELDAARTGMTELESSLKAALVSGDTARVFSASADGSLAQRVAAVGRHTARARAATDDPLWRAFSDLPYAGRNFAAVRAVAEATDAVAREALPQLAASAATLEAALRAPMRDGLPLAAVEGLATSLGNAADVTASARRTVAASEPGLLLGPVGRARGQLLTQLSTLHDRLQPAADAAAVAAPMLGASTPRTYFVAFVNPAEARGGGGLLGGFAIVQAAHGSVHVKRIGSNLDLPNLERGPTGLPIDFQNNYADYGADTDWNESNLSPHFPYTGQLWAKMYTTLTGTPVDGVLSLDPAALSVLLKGAPPIDVGGGARVTSANVVSFIQRDEYALPLTSLQRKDALTAVGRVAVSRLQGQHGLALPALLAQVGAAAGEGHVRLWSAVPREQAVLARYAVSGQVPAQAGPFVSVFVNNAGSGKLDNYLATTTTYAVRTCTAARRTVDVTVVLHNQAPSSGLPAYVTVRGDGAGDGDGRAVPVPGANRSLLAVMLTPGSAVKSATLNGRALDAPEDGGGNAAYLMQSTERGHPVASTFVDLDPGARATLVLHLDEPASAVPPTLLRQPMAVRQVLRSTTAC